LNPAIILWPLGLLVSQDWRVDLIKIQIGSFEKAKRHSIILNESPHDLENTE
jgi:hypothetical protein